MDGLTLCETFINDIAGILYWSARFGEGETDKAPNLESGSPRSPPNPWGAEVVKKELSESGFGPQRSSIG